MNKEKLNQLKKDQLKALDWYAELAESDESTRKFLVVMAARINTALHKLDTKENEQDEP